MANEPSFEALTLTFILSSATTAYPYLRTPSLLLHSATDTTIRGCYDDTPEFWQRWREEIADIGREIAAARPDEVGCYSAPRSSITCIRRSDCSW